MPLIIRPEFKPHGDDYLSSVELTNSINNVTLDFSTQIVNGSTIGAKMLEVNSVLSSQKLRVNIGNRTLDLPPFCYALLEIPDNVLNVDLVTDKTVFDFCILNILTGRKQETINTFGTVKRNVTRNIYQQKALSIHVPAHNAGDVLYITYSAGQGAISGQPITTPIKLQDADAKRMIAVFSVDNYLTTYSVFYGFTSATCNIPINPNDVLFNNPLFLSELWLKITYNNIAASAGPATDAVLVNTTFEAYGD